MKYRVLIVVSIVLVMGVAIAQSGRPQQQAGGMGMMCGGGMTSGTAMTKRAEIRVIPMKVFDQDKTDIARMRQIVGELQTNRQRAKATDPVLMRQFELEDELAQLLNAHLERATTDNGKSERAIAVQTKLNRMEGRMMCGACHGGGGGMMMGASAPAE